MTIFDFVKKKRPTKSKKELPDIFSRLAQLLTGDTSDVVKSEEEFSQAFIEIWTSLLTDPDVQFLQPQQLSPTDAFWTCVDVLLVARSLKPLTDSLSVALDPTMSAGSFLRYSVLRDRGEDQEEDIFVAAFQFVEQLATSSDPLVEAWRVQYRKVLTEFVAVPKLLPRMAMLRYLDLLRYQVSPRLPAAPETVLDISAVNDRIAPLRAITSGHNPSGIDGWLVRISKLGAEERKERLAKNTVLEGDLEFGVASLARSQTLPELMDAALVRHMLHPDDAGWLLTFTALLRPALSNVLEGSISSAGWERIVTNQKMQLSDVLAQAPPDEGAVRLALRRADMASRADEEVIQDWLAFYGATALSHLDGDDPAVSYFNRSLHGFMWHFAYERFIESYTLPTFEGDRRKPRRKLNTSGSLPHRSGRRSVSPVQTRERVGETCPECGAGSVVLRHTRRGIPYLVCDRYPECKYSVWIEA